MWEILVLIGVMELVDIVILQEVQVLCWKWCWIRPFGKLLFVSIVAYTIDENNLRKINVRTMITAIKNIEVNNEKKWQKKLVSNLPKHQMF